MRQQDQVVDHCIQVLAGDLQLPLDGFGFVVVKADLFEAVPALTEKV